MHQGKSGGVPDLIDEEAVALDTLLVQLDLSALGGKGGHGEAQGVGAVGAHHLQRIDDVAGGFGHLLAVLVADQGVQVDVVEGHLIHEVQPHHHHPGHPEEEDVEAGDQDRGGVEGGQLRGFVRPAQGGEGPEGRGEPGVQNIGLLGQLGGTALGAAGRLAGLDDQLAALGAGPGRDAMAPPDLPGDAPVADVVHPAVIGVVPGLGVDVDPPVAHRRHRLVGQGPHRDEPLLGGGGFGDGLAAIAVADPVLVGFDLLQEALFLQVGDDLLAAGEAIEAGVLAGQFVHHPVAVDDLEAGQVVAVAELVVVAVMRGGNLERPGAEILLHIGVGDHRDGPVSKGQLDRHHRQVGVALILGVDRHGRIAQHGLGPGGGDDQEAAAIGQRIADVVELAVGGLVFDLVVSQGGVAARAPVDHVVALVDQPFLVKADEDLAHRLRQPLVHGEAFPLPVAGTAQLLELVDDDPAFLLPPVPNPVDKLFTP